MVVIRFVGKAKTLTGKLLALLAARHGAIQPPPPRDVPFRTAARRCLDAYHDQDRRPSAGTRAPSSKVRALPLWKSLSGHSWRKSPPVQPVRGAASTLGSASVPDEGKERVTGEADGSERQDHFHASRRGGDRKHSSHPVLLLWNR